MFVWLSICWFVCFQETSKQLNFVTLLWKDLSQKVCKSVDGNKNLLYCGVLSLGGNVNTRRMAQPDMVSIFHIKNQWNILVIGNIMWIIEIFKIQWLYPPRILNEHCCIYSCLQIPSGENWFQYVRRLYATAINFPCIITLVVWFMFTLL